MNHMIMPMQEGMIRGIGLMLSVLTPRHLQTEVVYHTAPNPCLSHRAIANNDVEKVFNAFATELD